MATIPEALEIGWQHHQAGDLQQGEQIYCQILQVDPSNGEALYLLGVVHQVRGQLAEAVAFLSAGPAIPAGLRRGA